MAYKYAYDDEPKYIVPKKRTDRKMWKLMLFNILTLGFYSIFFFIPVSFDLDEIAPKRDRTKTMNYFLAYILAAFTFSIVLDVWFFCITARIDEALKARGVDYSFETKDFWLWFILGSLIIVGPFVYFHKMCKALNLLCENYNNANEPVKQ